MRKSAAQVARREEHARKPFQGLLLDAVSLARELGRFRDAPRLNS